VVEGALKQRVNEVNRQDDKHRYRHHTKQEHPRQDQENLNILSYCSPFDFIETKETMSSERSDPPRVFRYHV
jgi:hypothetical protein